jgi:putative ABC transport system permease protein
VLPKDIGYALRLFARSPGYVAMAVIALGFGIGANSSMFSFVNVYLLQPLPTVRDAGQIVILQGQQRGNNIGTSYLDFTDWEKQSSGFDGITAMEHGGPIVSGLGEPERAAGVRVSREFFRVFPVRPVAGRLFLPTEMAPGGDPVILISNGYWQRKFGSTPDVIGRSLSLDGVSHKIVGVLPAGFRFSWRDVEVFSALGKSAADTPRGRRSLDVLARRKPGTTLAAAQAEMNTIAARLEAAYPETNAAVRVSVHDLLQAIADGPRESVTIMMGVVVFVLLIACSNVANLQLARATGRANEMAIRIAIGASRWRIIRQLLTESMLVAVAGGVLGVGLGYGICRGLMAATPPMIHPFNQNYLDTRVLVFTAVLSILTGLISGIAPAFQVSRVGVNDTLKEGGRAGSAAGSRGGLRNALVVVEVSLAMVLLLAAGLLVKSFGNLQQMNPGFRVENLLTANVWLPETKYPKPEQQAIFFRSLLERAQSMPGVVSAAASTGIPLTGGGGSAFVIEGQPVPSAGHEAIARTMSVTPEYFQTMGMTLRSGRYFTEQDDDKGQRVVIVNERIARQYFGAADPIGRRVKWSPAPNGDAPWMTIVGVASDVRPWGRASQPSPEMYAPFRQAPGPASWVVVRTKNSDAASVTPALRAELKSLDRAQPLSSVMTMDERMNESMTLPKMMTVLISIFATLSLLLAAMGIYGVVSYSVAQRSHEFGIRMALGAGPGGVIGLVLKRAGWMVLLGVGIGIPCAAAITKVLQSFLFGVGARDPLTFVFVPLALASVALLASWIPARRATRVDPVVALRCE